MKVWLLVLGQHQQSDVEGVYSTLEKAQAAYAKPYGKSSDVWERQPNNAWTVDAYALVKPDGTHGNGLWAEIYALWLDDEVPG